MKLGFIILAHNQPAAIRQQVDVLAGAGHRVVVHFDTSAPKAQQDAVRSLESAYPGQVHVVSKVHCVWGEWSLVEAVLVSLREFAGMPEKPDYIHLMSGADFPIRPIADLEEFLRRNAGRDFIECCDITQRRWVKGGLSMERFRFFFPVNFRTRRKTFDRLVRWHRKLHIRRKIPLGMTPHMGSQWWTLRWTTCDAILSFLRNHPGVVRYFRLTWIPDESFFQTVVAHLVPRREIADLQLILHHLTPTGRPYVVHKDHLGMVSKLPHFFIRKVSPAVLGTLQTIAATRKSPIPRPSHLARVRDLVRGAIDRNYQYTTFLPGYPHGTPPRGPADHAIIVLTANDLETSIVQAHATAHPAAAWGGRPCAEHVIDLADDFLAASGLTRAMTRVRDTFPQQFAHTLRAAMPEDKVAVFVVQSGDWALTPDMVWHWPGIRFVSFSPHPYHPALAPDRIQRIPARHIPRLLDAASPLGAPASARPWLDVHQFGRIGNYFHLDATLGPVDMQEVSFVLPGVDRPIRPESSYVQLRPDGSARILLLFWVEDGVYLEIARSSPAHVLSASSRLAPVAIHGVREPSVREMLGILDSFGEVSAWSDRILLESVAAGSIPERCEFIQRARAHWSAESTAASMAILIADDAPMFPAEEDPPCEDPPADPAWEAWLEECSLQAARDPKNACAQALQAIQTPDLPRKELLRVVHSCLPRDSKWWLLVLAGDDSLGAEQVADALNSLGSSAMADGRAALAELCFSAAMILHPSAQSLPWNLGLLLASQGRTKDAQRAFAGIRRHFANESISTRWPALRHAAWPAQPWPTEGYVLPEGITRWPRISIITPSYQQGRFIEETILSVLHQNYPNLQYIVVDGGSTDETRSILETYRWQIDHLLIEPDDGQTQAINKGFRLADGEIVAWLNSDDLYAPGALHQAALHWLASGADVLAGICAEHRDHQFAVINKPSAGNRDFNTAQLARIFPHWFSGMYFFQPEVFFTKVILDKVGPLDEALHYAMDYDLWMRFARADARLQVIDWPCAFFRLHDAQKTSQSAACLAEQCAVRDRHHPLPLSDERAHQLRRQLAMLRTHKTPTLVWLATEAAAAWAPDAAAAATSGMRLVRAANVSDRAMAAADAILVPIGSSRREIDELGELRATFPDLLLLGWFVEADRDPHANYEAAGRVDVVLAPDPTLARYLLTDSAVMGPPLTALTPAALDTCLSRLLADARF
jgi:hypothetical protein